MLFLICDVLHQGIFVRRADWKHPITCLPFELFPIGIPCLWARHWLRLWFLSLGPPLNRCEDGPITNECDLPPNPPSIACLPNSLWYRRCNREDRLGFLKTENVLGFWWRRPSERECLLEIVAWIGVTPLQGLIFWFVVYPGLAPWAFVLRPVGASLCTVVAFVEVLVILTVWLRHFC